GATSPAASVGAAETAPEVAAPTVAMPQASQEPPVPAVRPADAAAQNGHVTTSSPTPAEPPPGQGTE
ncbi:MAG TPA: hypothetical protein VHT26_23025, partial [Trebonia sp.]|nr:hypothetical protein [Trebonia sp.]